MKIGFDLWGTLIKQNPLFTERKRDLIKKYMPFDKVEKVEEVLKEVKLHLNSVIEHSGWQPTRDVIEQMIASKVVVGEDNITSFMNEYQMLAILYPPELFDENTLLSLIDLSTEAELYIVSNTMYLNGSTLLETLNQLGIKHLFKKFYFSDQQQCSKPSVHINSKDKFDYFVGDSEITDRVYANKLGSKFILVNRKDINIKTTIKDVHDIITKKS